MSVVVARRALPAWAAVVALVAAFVISQIASALALAGGAFLLAATGHLKLDDLARGDAAQALLAHPLMLSAAIAATGLGLVLTTIAALKIAKLPIARSVGLSAPKAVHVPLAILLVMAAGPFADAAIIGVTRALPGATLGVLDTISTAVRGAPLSALLVGLTIALAPAFAEELFFRGVLQPSLTARLGPLAGVALASILFGAFHLDPPQAAGAAVLGLALGFVTWRTGSLWPAIAAHAANNGVAVAYARFGPREEIASAELEPLPLVASAALVSALLFAILRTTRERPRG
ncbi:MAG: CPBP family intramembrane metalloprotease [Polyangiaceae bacterium]|nr:CPBP family intramembrane metalloprotease [Polyangiaceae bacterium]MBK8941290.1 CPBP family intramembrane metalloprotease [Polyangiaceae bacterium]